MAINRPALRDRIMDGAAEPTGQLMPEGWFGWTSSLPVPAYDPDGGKRLMAEAGYPNGFRTTFHCTNNRYVNDGRLCQAIAQMLSRIGIQAEVQAQPFAAFIGPATRQEFSLFMLGWGIDTAEPSSPLSSLLATFDRAKGRGASNRGRYSNAEVDRLLDEALKTLDDEKRQQLFVQATEIAIRDVGLIALHHNVNVFATRRPLTYDARADEWTLAMGVRRGN